MRRRRREHDEVEMQMGPMIDMVFLLLVFFMVTARPIKEEADIDIGLPGSVAQEEVVDLPDEQKIVIGEDGTVVLNELVLGAPGDGELRELIETMRRFKQSADNNNSKAMVTLDPHDLVPHQRVVDVLNACAQAGVSGVTFSPPSGVDG